MPDFVIATEAIPPPASNPNEPSFRFALYDGNTRITTLGWTATNVITYNDQAYAVFSPQLSADRGFHIYALTEQPLRTNASTIELT